MEKRPNKKAIQKKSELETSTKHEILYINKNDGIFF